MKELEYPFDSAYIMKKRRSIKRTLLSDGSSRLKKRIAVLGGSTTNDIVSIMELFLLDMGIEPTFYQSEYAQYWQDAMFPGEELADFKPDIVFIHTTNRNITEFPKITDKPEDVDELLNKAQVVVTPGSGFGPAGEGYFRITSFADRQRTIEAMERIKNMLKI